MRAMLVIILLSGIPPTNLSKQSLKRIFVFNYLEACLNTKGNIKQFTTKERLTVGTNLEVDKVL